MTIKEQTIKRIEFQQEHNENDQKIYGRTSIFDRLELQYLEGVLKELEILEIIKDKLVVANLIGNGKIYHTISIPKEINKLTENQYEKIKEWVDNEN